MWGTFFLGFINPLFFIPFGLYMLSQFFYDSNQEQSINITQEPYQESFSVNIETDKDNDRKKYVSIYPSVGFDINKVYVESGILGNNDIEIENVDYNNHKQKIDVILNLNDNVTLNHVKVEKENNGFGNGYQILFNYDDGK